MGAFPLLFQLFEHVVDVEMSGKEQIEFGGRLGKVTKHGYTARVGGKRIQYKCRNRQKVSKMIGTKVAFTISTFASWNKVKL